MQPHLWAFIIAVINLSLWSILNIYVYYNLYLMWLAYKHRNDVVLKQDIQHENLPTITIQLPLYNEEDVCQQLFDAIEQINYPHDRYTIQILDDSTDNTYTLSQIFAQKLIRQHKNVQHIHRNERIGYKAGALANGLQKTHSDLLFILDADFIPNPNILYQLLPYFSSKNIAMVQARWGHLHAPTTALERTMIHWIDRHFEIEQLARSRSGLFFHFNGSAGIWKREAIEDAGGWHSDTLAEDLDLSLRAFQKGWKFVYAHDVVVSAQLPNNISALKVQQSRWSQGAFQVFKKHAHQLLKSKLSYLQSCLILIHLTGYMFPILLFLLSFNAAPAAWARNYLPFFMNLFCIDLPAFGFLMGLIAQCMIRTWRYNLRTGFIEIESASIGLGLAPTLLKAGLQGLRSLGGVFRRTPKFKHSTTFQINTSGLRDLALACVCFISVGYIFYTHALSCMALPLLSGVGLTLFGFGSFKQPT